MIAPYPLRTQPYFRDYIWGGRKLETVLGKKLPADGAWAESWEIIDHAEHQSKIVNGQLEGHTLRQLATDHPRWLFGDAPLQSVPLLLKYLDCQRVLSVQVHPNDEYGQKMSPPDLGKTEAWYIVDKEPGAKLYAGLRSGITAERLRAALEEGAVEECLHVIEPNVGDCVFIPAGTVHALGAGLLVAEIQQASNTTFRLFDWNRVGSDGNPRPLHVEQALDVIDFQAGPRNVQIATTNSPNRQTLVQCNKFNLDRIHHIDSAVVGGDGRFHIITAPYGNVELNWNAAAETGPHVEVLQAGQSLLLPAGLGKSQLTLGSGAVALDMYVPSR